MYQIVLLILRLRLRRQFFALPKDTKSEVKVSGPHRGFLPIGESTMEGYSGADQKESFIWGLDIGVNETKVDGDRILAGTEPLAYIHTRDERSI